jgi:galactokinase
MDQFISALGREGHLLLLDCRTRKTEIVPMQDVSVALLIINTNVKHELSGGEYAERRAQCEEAVRNLGVASLRDVTAGQLEAGKSKMSETVYRRARHVIGEIARTVQAAEVTAAGAGPTQATRRPACDIPSAAAAPTAPRPATTASKGPLGLITVRLSGKDGQGAG